MESSVVRMPLPEDATPGVDMTFETTIGEGRVLRLRTMFDQSTGLPEQKRILRGVLSIADAEKAHYELQDYRWQLRLKEKGLVRAEDDVKRLDKQNAERAAKIEVEIGQLRLERAERAQAHEHQFRSSGREGNFKRSSTQVSELQRLEADIAKLQAELQNINTTMTNERRDTMIALERIKQDIRDVQDEIDKRLFILGEPANES